MAAFLGVLRGTILEKANFDIDKVNPVEYAAKVKAPCLFVTGDDDYVVNLEQLMELYKAFGCEKKIFVVKGTHSDARVGDAQFMQNALAFLKEKLKEKSGVADHKKLGSAYIDSETTLSTQHDE